MSGLLNYLMSAADTSKRKLRSLFDDPIGNLQMSSDDNLKAFTGSIQNKLKPTQPSNMTWGQPEVNPADYLAGGVGKIVWHGSPHKFDKFDMSKIGTGEGAQAYGHGLYFAESPAVANDYAEKLALNRFLEFPGGIPSTEAEKRVADALLTRAKTTQTGSRESELAKLYDGLANPPKHLLGAPGTPAFAMPTAENIARTVENMHAAQKLGMPTLLDDSFLYKVDIPDEAVARMLDWDKPLSQQPESVITAIDSLGKIYKKGSGPYTYDYFPKDYAGKDIYKALSISDQASAAKMKELGIPGIRYLDGGSRTAGEGTSNYVLFDDQLPRILERNGTPTGLQPWNPGEWRGLLGD